MKRRDFIATTALGSVGVGVSRMALGNEPVKIDNPAPGRKIVVTGGGLNKQMINYIIGLTGKEKPRICYLPTASADDERSYIHWYQLCAGLDMIPLVQHMFITSYRMKQSWEDVFLSMDAIIVGGGNTLNMLAIWKAQGIDKILMKAWDQGIIMGGGSAGSLCWFEEGTTDSRPIELTKIECLGFLKGSHSPHYDAEPERRPRYHELIKNGTLKAGYAIDNNAAIYFEDNTVSQIVATNNNSGAYYVELEGGKIKETPLKVDKVLKGL